ncbi:patatin-like phospholipase family protein [Shewanella colwelliana]|uniref:Patatin family protein n=1 Tax=Shewanella colwelliana TaxID=23 RepID=A0A1E5IQV0_SHECO|nr:patatin family protein [Shewanella colwelliana]MDX1280487.1 patatin family protein [Shewanella colwelliana]OEG72916.1 patatin family protein [Shewanella colwelliana]GIU40680.1 patatin family protein [Shewanella colwelliana]
MDVRADSLTGNTALVLEGGGLRAIYTAGVLDAFLEVDVHFDYLVGVSAGAIYPASYLSRQYGRNLKIQQGFLADKRYMGFSHFLRDGNYVNTDFTYRRMANELIPYDFDAFTQSGAEFKVGAFNCETGETNFFSRADFANHDRFLAVLIASSSLPFISQPTTIDGVPYLDGGIGAPIPLAQARSDGYPRQVVILTQEPAYRKSAFKFKWLANRVYRQYPHVAAALLERHRVYNQALADLLAAQADGSALVLQPQTPLGLSRLERDVSKVEAVYHRGVMEGRAFIPQLLTFIN